MTRYRDQKGMTLIEVVVVLLISAIIMTLVGGMILSSMGYFSDEVVMDQDKEGLDDIVTYVRNQLLYSTDVRIAKEKPSDAAWQWLYIKDGVVYQNGKALLSKEYYQNRTIEIKVQGFENFRLDLNFKYLDTKSKPVYQTRTSLELLNVKVAVEKDSSYKPLENILQEVTINEENKIYYIKDPQFIDDGPIIDGDGTVAEQIRCLNNATHRGDFVLGMYYYKGDIVFYDGFYWMNVHKSDFYGYYPNGGRSWKKLYKYFDENSAYEVGDVVIYQKDNKRYQAKKEMIQWTPTPDSWNGTEGGYWQQVKDDVKDEGLCKGLIAGQQTVTVRNKLDNIDEYKIEEYKNGQKYAVDALVYMVDGNTGNKEFYLKVFEGNGRPGSNPNSGWQHLTRDYDSTSAYLKDDVVAYLQDSIGYIQFLQTIDQKLDISSEINQTYPGPSEYVKEYSEE